jgi:hypothetical protein
MVPYQEKLDLVVAAWDAQLKVTKRFHGRFRRDLQRRLRDEAKAQAADA